MNTYGKEKNKTVPEKKPWYYNKYISLIFSACALLISFVALDVSLLKTSNNSIPPPSVYNARVTLSDVLPVDSIFLQFTDRICHEEGFRSHIYEDTRGNKTIGCGWNLEFGISEMLAKLVVEWQVVQIQRSLEESWIPFKEQSENVQWGLVDAAFNLGVHGLLKFIHMLDALEHNNLSRAVSEIRDSKWFHDEDTKSRAQKLIDVLQGS